MTEAQAPLPPPFENTAYRDWRVWLALIGGLSIAAFALAADASDSCAHSGNCSPVISAVTQLAGLTFAAFGLAALLRNSSRGSHFDPGTGELAWWRHKTRTSAGDGGRIHPARIGRILIVHHDDSADSVSVYDQMGERLPHLDEEVLPWRTDLWIEQLVSAYPHIVVERR